MIRKTDKRKRKNQAARRRAEADARALKQMKAQKLREEIQRQQDEDEGMTAMLLLHL
jgi:hypothetical protein